MKETKPHMDLNTLYDIVLEAALGSDFASHYEEGDDEKLDQLAANAILAFAGDINEPLTSGNYCGQTVLYAASTITHGERSLPKTLQALKVLPLTSNCGPAFDA